MKIENTTGRLLEPVYLVPGHHTGGPVVLPIYHKKVDTDQPKAKQKAMVGVPPGVHSIDEVSAAILLAHKPNKIFFEAAGRGEPMLKIDKGHARSDEDDERHQPVMVRCRSEAIAAYQQKAQVSGGTSPE